MPVVDVRSKAEFDRLLEAHATLAIQAHATWCGPCRIISPIFEKLADGKQQGEGDVAFARFDADEVADLADALKVRSIPTFFFYKDGQLKDKLAGPDPGALTRAIDALAN
ncbi:Thioredoxin [Moelleriella libera RCEF 2490]|uniref:Thioredoxin n=1 Tax=Moelleriella libera RCEF 2490 TaxID=1081109 RepID=A0A168DF36_9HYPO|nr:Thioredoxin [Moelleriella libera RCEF 2490]